LLVIEGLTRYFGALSALDGVSLTIAPRERRAIIGPNGAGKTTLFNLITGHLAPSAGRMLLTGDLINGLRPHAVARRGISRSFQRTNLFPKLSVLENLRLAAAAGGRGSYDLFGHVERYPGPLDRARAVADMVGLGGCLTGVTGRLSYGEQRQLEVGWRWRHFKAPPAGRADRGDDAGGDEADDAPAGGPAAGDHPAHHRA
jgi:branched-chain amino acid transport system ATP-binding protein